MFWDIYNSIWDEFLLVQRQHTTSFINHTVCSLEAVWAYIYFYIFICKTSTYSYLLIYLFLKQFHVVLNFSLTGHFVYFLITLSESQTYVYIFAWFCHVHHTKKQAGDTIIPARLGNKNLSNRAWHTGQKLHVKYSLRYIFAVDLVIIPLSNLIDSKYCMFLTVSRILWLKQTRNRFFSTPKNLEISKSALVQNFPLLCDISKNSQAWSWRLMREHGDNEPVKAPGWSHGDRSQPLFWEGTTAILCSWFKSI